MSPEQAAEKWENDWLTMGSAARRASLAALIREREQAVYAECKRVAVMAVGGAYRQTVRERTHGPLICVEYTADVEGVVEAAIEAARIAAGGE